MAWAVVLAMVCLVAPPAFGQNEVLNELYGSGVHAYNSGSYLTAYNNLTMAIRSGSHDPRVYYFRGLAYLRLGRPQEARADFNKAATMEMSNNDQFYPVSKSLERIQGAPRLQIERARASARLVAYRGRERGWYERYHRIRKNEPNVLAPPDAAAKLPAPNKPAPSVEKEPAEEMPAEDPADDSDAADTKKPVKKMPAEKPADDDPFSADADDKKPAEKMPAEKEGDDDPFGADADDKKPAEKMPAEKEGDDDPFGADADDKKPADEMPAEKEGDDDPFGADADDKKPADEMPADKEGDDAGGEEMKDEGEAPAGEEKAGDEKKPEDEDPFGT